LLRYNLESSICALYEKKSKLLNSHIYPKFIIKHTKKTGSSYLRNYEEPNKRAQDGPKIKLLSFEAEQALSIREKWFAENIFVPYLSKKYQLQYDQNLYYFALSFLWRVIHLELRSKDLSKKWYYSKILEVEKEWRNYLTNITIPQNFHNVNIVFTDRIENNNSNIKGADFYLTRALDATIVDNKPKSFLLVYGKFNRFIFYSVVKSPPINDELYDVEINPNGGILEIPQNIDYYPFNSFFSNRMRGIEKLPKASSSQQDLIEKEILKNPNRFWDSDLGQSLMNDIDLDT